MDAENGERGAFGGLLVDEVVCPPRGESLCTVVETGWVCGVHFGRSDAIALVIYNYIAEPAVSRFADSTKLPFSPESNILLHVLPLAFHWLTLG